MTACSSAEPAKLEVGDYQLAVEMNTAAQLDVLAQASGVANGATFALAAQPANGTATLGDDGTLTYTPAMDYLGSDDLSFTITNPDGKHAIGHVAVTVGCSTCALGVTITLAWNPNPASDNVLGYRMYMGPSTDTSTLMQIDDISVTQPGFDPTMPSISYDGWLDLHLELGANVCFALTAYNSGGESGFSNPACATVQHGHMMIGVGG